MTVTTTTSRTKLPTNGSDTAFVFDFQLLDSGDFNARHIAADLTETDLVLGVDYTLSASPWATGGTLNTIGALSPLANGNIVMWRDMDYEQLTNLLNNKGYEANNLEDIFDGMTLLSQQLNDENDRTLTMDIDSLITNAVVEDPLANAVLKWNADADAVENGAVTTEIVNADANAISAAADAVTTAADVAPTAASAAAAAASETAAIAMVAGGIDIGWIQAAQIGSDLNITGIGVPALAALNGTDVAFIDATNDDLRLYRWDEGAGTWSQIGNDLNISGVSNSTLTALNGTDIAFIDNGNKDLRVYRWNEGTGEWSQVGNDLNIAGIGIPALAALNGTDVAFIDGQAARDKLTVYRFDGTDWAQVGNYLQLTSLGLPVLTALNGTDVAFIDGSNDDLRLYRFDGTDWAQVGNDLNTGVFYLGIAALNGTDIAFVDSVSDNLRVYRFTDPNWAQVGNDLNLAGIAGRIALAALNGTDVAFIDLTNNDLRTYRFAYYVGDGPHMLQ